MKYVYFFLGCIIFYSCNYKSIQKDYQNYPDIVKGTVQENYFGTIIEDDYRNIENLRDTTVIKWFKKQSLHANKYIGEYTDQKSIANQMEANFLNKPTSILKVRYTDNGFSFFLKEDSIEKSGKLFYRKTSNSKDIELFDPTLFQSELKREYTISYIQPSWDGKYVLVALSYDGVTGSNLIIIDVLKRKILPEIITNAEPENYLGVSWLPDSSGFLYLYIPELDSDDEQYMLNSSTVLYRIGEDSNKRNIIFSSAVDSKLTGEDLPIAKIISKNDSYMIGYVATVDNYWSAYYAKISDLDKKTIDWKPLYSLDEKVYSDYGFFINDYFVYVSGKDANNRTISRFDLKDIENKNIRILVPEKEDQVISEMVIANNIMYYTTSKFGVEASLYSFKNNEETKIELPHKSGDILLFSSSNESPNLWIGISGWTIDYTRYAYVDDKFILDALSSNQLYPEFENIIVEEIQVKSHDGAQIPLSLIYQKGIKLNGLNPTFIYAYGAYGESISPFFSPIFLNWVQNGGVFVVPHIRGGGEKGDSWHKQGMKLTKSNSWKDIIVCTQYLIDKKYTSKDKTVLYGSSAGGIASGMAIVERPDLYQVFIADVPMLNPLRSEARTDNASNYLEYGTVKDSIECLALIKMDPYVNLKRNVEYPASLIISGFNDARIDPWIPGKFVARLQEYTSSDSPVFFDVVYNSGHEGGDTNEEIIYEYSKIFAFAFWQTNHTIK